MIDSRHVTIGVVPFLDLVAASLSQFLWIYNSLNYIVVAVVRITVNVSLDGVMSFISLISIVHSIRVVIKLHGPSLL